MLRSLVAALLTAGLLVAGCQKAPPATQPEAAPAADASIEGVGEPAWVSDAAVYELFIPDFTEAGTFRAAIGRLDALDRLGINTIWLMPIHPIGEERRKGALGSPYAIRDYYAVNPNYGTKEDFRAFVDAAHARGIKVIIDFVANHTAWDHPWTEAHPAWYTGGAPMVPVSPSGDTTNWTDVADLNYDNPALRQEMIDVMQYWVRAFNIDGYRCDVAGWVPDSFWTAAIDSVETIKPVLMLAEHADPAIHQNGFDWTYAWPFYGALKKVWADTASVRTLAAQVDTTLQALPPGAERLRFTTNHDETAWDAPPPALFDGIAGAQAATMLAFTMSGIPLIYNGQELGVREPVPFFEATPYDWSQESAMRPFFRTFFSLYSDSEALREGALDVLDASTDDVLLYTRTATEDTLLIAVNVRDRAATVPVPATFRSRVLTDAIEGVRMEAAAIELPPYGFMLLEVE
ncbi:alpha-amylase family glycosyl hydrolase [Salisaeta longa]|uniref:alpha-amylase family glycosyl hydrolase n=1 Tax=Salisaeta longa TaxID=503170 RepID=UPI0003B60E0E|nr:alpha-amylase family glycosyl hydrolase [Salisaeta longa]